MTNETLLVLFSGGGLALLTAVCAGIWWVVSRVISYQGQFRILENNIQILEGKVDRGFQHLEDKIDLILTTTNALMSGHNERITRLEKYFDAIMQSQIKRNRANLSMGKK